MLRKLAILSIIEYAILDLYLAAKALHNLRLKKKSLEKNYYD